MQEDLNTGKQEIIYNPGRERLCRNCPKQNICQEEIEISMPIRLKSETIGVIGLVGSSREQKERILENESMYLKLLEQDPRQYSRVLIFESTRTVQERYYEMTNMVSHVGVSDMIGRDPKTLQLQEEILMAKEIIFTPKAPRLWGRLEAWWRLSVWLRNKPVRGSYEHSRK